MPVPNKCDDCPFGIRDECHAIFGKTAEGHGLFPLSRAAAKTASRLANRQTFRPRTVLSEVVGPVISDRLRQQILAADCGYTSGRRILCGRQYGIGEK